MILLVWIVIKYNPILYLNIIFTKAYISCNCFYINIIKLNQLLSVIASKKKIINLIILISKKRYYYNNISKKIASTYYIKKKFI